MADQGSIPILKGVIQNQYITDNTTNDITAEKCREAFDDTIDTLYSEILDLGEGRCESEKIEFVNGTKDINFESELKICGNKGTFTAKVDFFDRVGNAETSDSLATIVSAKFPQFKWLKPVKYYHVVDEADQVGNFGGIQIKKLNSYTVGDPTEDGQGNPTEETLLLLSGNTKGVGRFYNFDLVDQYRLEPFTSPINPEDFIFPDGMNNPQQQTPYDRTEDVLNSNTSQFNYDVKSPFDLSTGNFSINILNNKAYFDKIGGVPNSGQQTGTVRIFFEFILL